MICKEKEEAFQQLIKNTAEALNKVFIIECSEGRDLETDKMYMEDFSGWLCPKDTPEEKQRDDEFYCFAEWEMILDKPVVRFVKH